MRSPIVVRALLVLILWPAIPAFPEDFHWVRQMGGATSDRAFGVVLDKNDNVYTCGAFSGTADFDPGPGTFNLVSTGGDVFISKLDREGRFLWAGQFGGGGTTGVVGGSIAVDVADNLFIAGQFSGTTDFDPGPGTFLLTPEGIRGAFIVKLDSAGSLVWARQFAGTGLVAAAAVRAHLNSVIVVGYFANTIDFDPGPGTLNFTSLSVDQDDAFVASLDSAGNLVWAGQVGGPDDDRIQDVVVDAGGSLYAVGRAGNNVDFDPGPGVYSLSPLGFVLKLDRAGNFVWVRKIAELTFTEAWSVALDGAGNVYTVGGFTTSGDFDPGPGTFSLTSAGSFDGFVSKLDGAGNFLWAARVGGTGFDNGLDIAVDAIGNIFLSGPFSGTADFDPGPGTFNLTSAGSGDGFAAKFGSAGHLRWAAPLGGALSDSAGDLALDSDQNVYVAGYFLETADFDPGPNTASLTSTGSTDAYLWKYGSCDIRLQGNAPTTIGFSPDSASVSFNVVSGLLSGLRATNDFSAATCLGTFSANPATDESMPPLGDAFYYLARGLSVCAADGYGDSTLDPDPRDALDLAGPCP